MFIIRCMALICALNFLGFVAKHDDTFSIALDLLFAATYSVFIVAPRRALDL